VSEPWEAEVFRVPDIGWQTEAPPSRHPMPVRYARGLEPGDEVTIGLPGRCFIDGQLVASGERRPTAPTDGSEPEEALAVAAPYAYWLARGFPHVRLTMQFWPVSRTWVYRDAVAPADPDAAEEPPADDGSGSWLDHVVPDLHEPPVRTPRPAREAGALSGRTLRLQHERGAWSWWVAVSEPVDEEGEFVVHVLPPSEYWLAQAQFESAQAAQPLPLYRLWVYE
jgi:hypothetical protein